MAGYDWSIDCDFGLWYFYLLLRLKLCDSFLQILLTYGLFIFRIVDIRVKLQWLATDNNFRIVVDHEIHLTLWGRRFLEDAIFFEFGSSEWWLFFSTWRFLLIEGRPEHSAAGFFDRLNGLRNVDWGGFAGRDNWVLVGLDGFLLAVFKVSVIVSGILVLFGGVVGGVLVFTLNLLKTLLLLVKVVWDVLLGVELVT